MADLAFARQFLQTLSSRPSALSPTHVEDPKTYPARGAYILPHPTLPPLARRPRPRPSTSTIPILLTSPRNPPLSIRTSQPLSISILELKTLVSSEASIPVSKIKVLYSKKPVGDARTLSELLGAENATPEGLELGVLVMGGAASVVPREPKAAAEPANNIDETPGREIEMRDVQEGLPAAAGGMQGREAINTLEFWDDLKGFLVQRLRDERLGGEVAEKFKQSLVGGV